MRAILVLLGVLAFGAPAFGQVYNAGPGFGGCPITGCTYTGQVNFGSAVGVGSGATGVQLVPTTATTTIGRNGNAAVFALQRTDATLTNGTNLGNLQLQGENSTGASNIVYASILGTAATATTGAETGQLGLRVAINGSITTIMQVTSTGMRPQSGFGYLLESMISQVTTPTISSGFGTSPSVVKHNGTAAFTINVGTGGTATNGVIGLPTAANGWACAVVDLTTQSSTVFITKEIASSTTTATLANFNTSGAQAAWNASDILSVQCTAY